MSNSKMLLHENIKIISAVEPGENKPINTSDDFLLKFPLKYLFLRLSLFFSSLEFTFAMQETEV